MPFLRNFLIIRTNNWSWLTCCFHIITKNTNCVQIGSGRIQYISNLFDLWNKTVLPIFKFDFAFIILYLYRRVASVVCDAGYKTNQLMLVVYKMCGFEMNPIEGRTPKNCKLKNLFKKKKRRKKVSSLIFRCIYIYLVIKWHLMWC
jgi:hypothetical protein